MIPSEILMSPIVLRGQTQIAFVAGLKQEVDSDKLINRTGTAIYVDNLAFTMSSVVLPFGAGNSSTDNQTAATKTGLPGLIRLGIEAGRHQLVRPKTPMVLCARYADFSRECAQDVDGLIGGVGGGGQPKAPDPLVMIWQFEKPLYLPNGQSLTVTTEFDGLAALIGTGLTIEVTARGRAMRSNYVPPQVVPIPYATFWMDQVRQPPWSPTIYVNSSAADLINPFRTNLYVSEFRGHYLSQFGAKLFEEGIRPVPFNPASGTPTYSPNVGFDNVQLQVINSGARDGDHSVFMVRDLTFWNQIFSPTTQAWRVKTILESNRWAQLRVRYSGTPTAVAPTNVRFAAGMVGFRMVYSKDLELNN